MASKSVNTGDAGRLRIVINPESGSDAGNYTDVSWYAYLDERSTYNYSFSNGTSASVVLDGVTVFSGSFAWDWRSGGLQSTLIASGTRRIYHNANGTKTVTGSVSMGATGTSGAGGPASVSLSVGLPTRVVVPGVPTGVVAARVSDTQTQVSWSQTSASNGQPTTNTIQERVNDGAWTDLVTVSATTTTTISTAPNEKTEYRVRGNNAAGSSAYSVASAPIYTTPAAPSDASAIKGASLDIEVSFTPHVGYLEHEHEIEHGVVSGGVTTWDGTPLVTLPSGTVTYTHVAPNSAEVHVYRVRATAGALASTYSVSNSVQLLVAPNKPTVPALAQFADKSADFVFDWNHNSVDTTSQSAYEFSYSTDGGSSWTSSGKVASSVSEVVIPASTYTANTTLTMRVRTWGSATTGGSEGTGASPWSDLKAVTFKTEPVATITIPANGATLNDATLRVSLGFSQAEAATFVKATLRLIQAGVTVEELDTGTLLGTRMATPVENGLTYTVSARVQDSNGLWSDWVSNTFDVEYLQPVTPVVTLTFLPTGGFGQIDLLIPEPEAGEAATTSLSITRKINGKDEEVIVEEGYPASPELTFLDTTPVINGTNTYTITVVSALGAQKIVVHELVTTECRRAYLSKGTSYSQVATFGANLSVSEALSVASDTVEAAGRVRPIGLYGIETSVQLKVSSFLFEGFGSTIPEVRAILLLPGKACYRDSSGRRVFGTTRGSVSYKKATRADLSFTLIETS